MTLERLRLRTGPLHRPSLLAATFAVLWVKGALWWIFGVSLGQSLASAVLMPLALELAQNAESAGAWDGRSEGDDLPPMPPTKPFHAPPEFVFVTAANTISGTRRQDSSARTVARALTPAGSRK